MADKFHATRTPQVFVLDNNRIIRYCGRIDDQYGVGYIRDAARQTELRNAIDELLAGKKVTQSYTKAVGCLIGRVHEAKNDSDITYSNQIVRILQKRCVECHREGEIAPFALTKYEEVAGWAEMIAEVVDQGRMPPWHASPKHGKFANDRALTQKEKETIFTWVRNGAPKGKGSDLPQPEQYTEGWQLPREPDVVFTINKEPFRVPAEGAVRYQWFRVDTNFKEDKWVHAAQIVPGNRAVVHHILAFAVEKGKLAALGQLGEGAGGFLAGYVPGQRAYAFPSGIAKKIPAQSTLVFQVHYTPVGTEQLDQSKIGFVFADPKTITHEVVTTNAVQRRLNIRPNQADQKFEATSRYVAKNGDLLLGLLPHMHLRGQAFRYDAVQPKKKETLLHVPQYDFNWQTSYRLAEPMPLEPGTRIHCEALFDNSEFNLNNPAPEKTVGWGPQTWDEMMIGYFDVARPVAKKGNQANAPVVSERTRKLFQLLDRNKDGKILREELPARLAQRFAAVDNNYDNVVTLEELAAALDR